MTSNQYFWLIFVVSLTGLPGLVGLMSFIASLVKHFIVKRGMKSIMTPEGGKKSGSQAPK